jgi:hypothetical protein
MPSGQLTRLWTPASGHSVEAEKVALRQRGLVIATRCAPETARGPAGKPVSGLERLGKKEKGRTTGPAFSQFH